MEEPSPIITKSTAEQIENEFETNETEAKEKVEAALFIAGRFLTLQELIMLTDVNPIMLKSILCDLEKKYSHGTLRIIRRKESYKMDIAEKISLPHKQTSNRISRIHKSRTRNPSNRSIQTTSQAIRSNKNTRK